MSILADLQLGEDHPLLLELASLRAAASRYQVRNNVCGASPSIVLIYANTQVSLPA